MIKVILFDFDGVLADTEHLHCSALKSVLESQGYQLTDEDYFTKYIGYDDRGAFRTFLNDQGAPKALLSDASIQANIQKKTTEFQSLASSKPSIYEGVPEIITSLSEHWPLSVVSGALGHEIRLILSSQNLMRFFQFVISAEDCKESKPAPEPYLKAHERLKLTSPELKAAEILVIEDSRAGIESARGAGMKTVGILRPYAKAADLEKADHVIRQLNEITPAWIRKI